MHRLILIDGNAILHRAYHAFPLTLQTRTGELTNATYGFTSTLLTVCKNLKPTHLIVTFDARGPTFRHQKYDGYKAHRPKMDENLVAQIDRTKQVVDTLNIPRFELTGFEADDIIGTLSKQPDFEEIIIVTGDRDELQLLTDKVKVYFPSRGRTAEKMVDRELFIQEWGFAPQLLVDFKALAGDASDEIPGVKGIGPKTAKDLIWQYGEIETIYQHLPDIKPAVREKLIKSQEIAHLSKELAKISLDVPLAFNLNQSLLRDYDKDKVIALFDELEFRSLVNRLPLDNWESGVEAVFGQQKSQDKIIKDKTRLAKDQMKLNF